jgi:hypothetical protein
VKRVALVVWFEELVPRALSYEEARLIALARGEERRRLIKLLLGEDSDDNEENEEA